MWWTSVSRGVRVGMLSFAVGCAAPGGAGPSPFEGGYGALPPIPEITVNVQNEHWAPMRIWIERPDGRFFIGEVEPGDVEQFVLPGHLVTGAETLRISAVARGTIDEVRSDPLDLRRGRHIEFRLRRVLLSSRARIL